MQEPIKKTAAAAPKILAWRTVGVMALFALLTYTVYRITRQGASG